MKKLFGMLVMVFCLQATAFSQDMYTKKMQQTMGMIDSAKTTEQLQALSAQFERIGDAEKTKWLPYYYAALCNTNIGWSDKNIDKDKLADKSTALLDKAAAIEDNSEIYCVRNMVAIQQLMVNPMERYQTYGPKATEALEKAKKLDANNPRIYYLEGSTVLNTPSFMGGGPDKAKPILKKSLDLFAAFQPASPLHPTWGRRLAEQSYAKCQ
jgi:hypothetical protein